MKTTLASYLSVLVLICAYIIAASPLNLPSTAQLNVKNMTLPSLHSISLSDDSPFPPSPPPNPYLHPVPNSPLTLNFSNYELVPGRNEADVQSILSQALLENAAHTDRGASLSVEELYEYAAGDLFMEMWPEGPWRYKEGALTWELWMQALIAVTQFVAAYPGLNFGVQVFVEGERLFVASAVLTNM